VSSYKCWKKRIPTRMSEKVITHFVQKSATEHLALQKG